MNIRFIDFTVDLDTIWGAYAATSLKGKKKIFDAHEYFTELPEVINRPLTKKVWEWTAKIWIPQSDLCLTVNSPLAQILHQKYDKHFHAIKNMPTKKEGPPTSLSPGSSRILLYQGVLNVGRGLEELISIMNELPRYQLWLVGEGDLSDHLRAMAAMSTSKDRIHFLGYKSPEELAFITPQAFVGFNLLSSDSANYYYSLANKFFDYVQAGIPQVSMNFPAYREYISEYAVGVLVEDLSAQSLLSAISDFENEAVYSKAVSACKQAVNQWSWERESPALMKAVAELFSQK